MVAFRITYSRYGDLRDDVMQMERGGVLVRVSDIADLELGTPAQLELVLPDGATLETSVSVLQVLTGHGVAVTIGPEVLAQLRGRSGRDTGTSAAKHERLHAPAATEPVRVAPRAPSLESMSTAEKIQLALHGNRDQRNAILRDSNRTLHQYVLKNPQTNADDVLAIAKNATSSPEVLKLIGERREWFQRPQIAVALARNPKTPPELAVRVLDYVAPDVLRQMAKGVGALPHVVHAARKKVIK